MGTPAVGYRVQGLRDSIVDGKTGLLSEPFNPSALADKALKVLEDPKLAENLSLNALRWSANFSWDRAAREFSLVLNGDQS
jgi:glycosyltransferase involved in cell wall biosynthesis